MREHELYNKYLDKRHWDNHENSELDYLITYLENNDFKGKLIELGCGNGHFVNYLSDYGYNTIGTDKSKSEIELAQNTFPTQNFEIQNVENLYYKDNSIEGFYMINVIHYVDQRKALKEIFRTLIPNGFLFIHFNLSIVDSNNIVDYKQDRDEILSLIKDFKIVHKREFERIDFEPQKHTHKILELVLIKSVIPKNTAYNIV